MVEEADYVGVVADAIRGHLDSSIIPPDSDDLFRLYALLALSVGEAVSARNVHDAWCIWQRSSDPGHQSLVPFDKLDAATQAQDEPFAIAIRATASKLPKSSAQRIDSSLFHAIDESNEKQIEQRFEQYKIMVESSERLVARRQGVNTFFLTANGAIITAIGLLVQASGVPHLKAVAITALALAAIVICTAWNSLITSFGQLNTGKFAVINRIERRLPLGLFSAEWEALERGENPKVYRSFTQREGWVPKLLVGVYIVAVVASAWVAVVDYRRTANSPATHSTVSPAPSPSPSPTAEPSTAS